jgi:hypothetical protein
MASVSSACKFTLLIVKEIYKPSPTRKKVYGKALIPISIQDVDNIKAVPE